MYYRDEDSKFVRDAVYLIGRKREEMLFVTVPLGRYKKRPKSHTGVYLCSGVAAVAMWAVYYWLGCDWAHISGYCHDSVESVCIRPIK